MLGGAYYIWIMLTVFLGCGAILLLVGGVLWVGHWLERRETGAKHGFLEMPEELRGGTTEISHRQPQTDTDGGVDDTKGQEENKRG